MHPINILMVLMLLEYICSANSNSNQMMMNGRGTRYRGIRKGFLSPMRKDNVVLI